jgi:pyruvate carboxylase
MRDGHQSLLATRMRSIDIIRVAPAYAAQPAAAVLASNAGAARPSTSPCASCRNAPGSGCAHPRGAPNLMTQMLLRGSNGVGYTNYPTMWSRPS